MFFLKKVFRRRKKKAEREDSQKAIDNLKEMEALILRKQLLLEEKIQKELETAKKHQKSNKRLALSSLRRKKIHENELIKVIGVLMKLMTQIAILENADPKFEVNDIMDEIDEDLAISEELAAAISRPIGSIANEDKLICELEGLEVETKFTVTTPNSTTDDEGDQQIRNENIRISEYRDFY